MVVLIVTINFYLDPNPTRWEIIDPYWANFFVAKLLCEYLSDSRQIWNSKRYFYGECFYRFRFFVFCIFAGK